MKTAKLLAGLQVALLGVISARAQGNFQNLNFEEADPMPIVGSPYYPYAVTFASALPGWSASINGVPVTQIVANAESTGEATLDIYGPGWNFTQPGIIDGNYTVFLQAFNPAQGNVSLWQNGTIPANAESLQFSAWSYLPNPAFSVSFAGNSLSPVVLSSGQTSAGQPYDVYGVNIASYAGQTGQLEFTALDNNPPGQIELDDINFSTISVAPEPDPLVLTGLGGACFAFYHWRNRRKRS